MDKKQESSSLLSHNGKIQVILGPMFSGKSTELLRRIRRFTVANRTCVLINYLGDNRYNITPHGSLVLDLSNVIDPIDSAQENTDSDDSSEPLNISSGSNHIITHEKVAIKSHGERTLKGFKRRMNGDFKKVDVIGIDEAQFFPDICKYADKWANMGKIVIIAALDGTFQRKGFNDILNIISIAEDVTKLTSVCHFCGNDASFTLRIGDSMEIEVIGGGESYKAVCRHCYYNHVK